MRRLAFLLLLLVAAAGSYAEQPCYFDVILLTTNDLHANLQPYGEEPNPPGPKEGLVGGAARRATVAKRERTGNRSPVLLLDSGDITHASNGLAKAFHGAADIAVMNAMGYDAMEPGNHDFQRPASDSRPNIKGSRFAWICANLINGKTGKLLLSPQEESSRSWL